MIFARILDDPYGDQGQPWRQQVAAPGGGWADGPQGSRFEGEGPDRRLVDGAREANGRMAPVGTVVNLHRAPDGSCRFVLPTGGYPA